MRLAPFELSQPETVDEVVAALAEADGDACLIAGGTALVPMLRLGLLRPGRVIALHRARDLDRLEARGAALHIGAMATLAAVHRSSVIWSGWPMLAAAAGKVATPAIRSTATIGGNLGYAEAASDLAPALLCLDAEVEVAGPAGQRRLPLSEFFTGFYETALGPGELVTAVGAPAGPPGARGGYIKFCPRSAEDKPLVGVAAMLALDGEGRCRHVRIGLGAAAPTAIRAARAEAGLGGQVLDDAAIQAAADTAAAEADPISDLMGSRDYRRAMVRVWVRRLLSSLRADPDVDRR